MVTINSVSSATTSYKNIIYKKTTAVIVMISEVFASYRLEETNRGYIVYESMPRGLLITKQIQQYAYFKSNMV